MRSSMASLRGLAFLVWVFAQALLVPSVTAKVDCVSLFDSSIDQQPNGIGPAVTIQIDTHELVAKETVLYTLSWNTTSVTAPTINDPSFTEYFFVNDTTDGTWEVSVKKTLEGVPDYTPNPPFQNKIEIQVNFPNIGHESGEENCIVTLTHNIIDDNTQLPLPEKPNDSVDIEENFMPNYPINGFRSIVQDMDGTSPNNQFTVSMDADCPLEATKKTYTSGEYPASVAYQLKRGLDFEKEPGPIVCDVAFQDPGNPPQSTKATITVNVINVRDEPPVFTDNFYYAKLDSIVVTNMSLEIMPTAILAVDGDAGALSSPITYSMTDMKEGVDGTTYFKLDKNTGEVTLIQDLEPSFLLNEQVMFFLKASDSSQTTAYAVLAVTLPPVPTTTTSTTTASTTTDTTCEPCICTTYTTEEATECPTLGSCPPCTTETPTECPTTPTEGTCPPCTTEAPTECPTTPTEGTDSTITWGPDQPTLIFERPSYTGSIYAYVDIVYQVKVKDIGYEVIYDWSDGYESNQYFDIDPTSGYISVKKDVTPPEGLHQLEATAMIKTVHSEKTTAMVNIHVLALSSDQVVISKSVMKHEVMEGEEEEDVATFTVSQPAGRICIIAAQPLNTHESFSLSMIDDKTWKVRKTGPVNYEETHEITLAIEAFYEDGVCNEVTDEILPNVLRSQALVIITVKDKNDEKPFFNSKDLVVAYPTNEGLRRAVGPVATVQAVDEDTTVVKYSVAGTDADQFTVDEETGEVYVVKSLDCTPQCDFTVNASDDINAEAQLNVKVLPLDMEHVFTLHMNKIVSEVDDELARLSQSVGAQISKLYVSPTQPTTSMRGRRHKREAQMNLEVHVYSIKEDSLMNLNDLNSALGEASAPLQAEKFIDEVVFEPEVQDTTGLTVGVAVLGSLLGIVLIVGIAFIVIKKKKARRAPKTRSPSPPISTLGNAYQNQSYEKDGLDMQGSLGHKTNGSLKGFTSVQVHSTPSGDSPPMHRSPLALPSDSIPLRNLDNGQQQGGLRRTNPSAPDYYGSSTPAPPPSFTRTTAATPPEPSTSSSSSFPIYAEIKKPKDPKPKSTAFAVSSFSSSRDEKNAPRTDFPSDPIDKKPAVPNADYKEVSSSKFSALKNSPPPRRSNHHKDDDDDDKDVKEGVAYPGGKDDSLANDSGDEKKSVAFKVMVDTKEIEAENMGPSQKKAEAEKLMEANRMKLRDEDDEEDEEGTVKL